MASLTHQDVNAAKAVYMDVLGHLQRSLKQHVSNKEALRNVEMSDWETVMGTLTTETFEVVLSGITGLPLELIMESVQAHPCFIETQICDKASVRIFFYWVEPPQPHQRTTRGAAGAAAPAGSSAWSPLALFLLIALVSYFAYTKQFLIEQYFTKN